MAAALEHMARMEGLPTSYEDSSDATRIRKNKTIQRSRKFQNNDDDNDDGPPDKNEHFQSSK